VLPACRGAFVHMAELSHRNDNGELNMVNVGGKAPTKRRALAEGRILLKSAYEAVKNDKLKKGSVIECARIAGILAAKKTGNLIPLCHPLSINYVSLNFEFKGEELIIRSVVECEGKTGVEMEALTAVSVACLTVYDMAKSVDKNMEIRQILLMEKEGGKSGKWISPKNNV